MAETAGTSTRDQVREMVHAFLQSPSDLNLRDSQATHWWGHRHLVSLNPSLRPLNTPQSWLNHLSSSSHLLSKVRSEIYDIIIDDVKLKAVVHMSYFLTPKLPNADVAEEFEQDLIWIFTFKYTSDGKRSTETLKLVDSVEYIDPTAPMRLIAVLKDAGVVIDDTVTGSLGLKQL